MSAHISDVLPSYEAARRADFNNGINARHQAITSILHTVQERPPTYSQRQPFPSAFQVCRKGRYHYLYSENGDVDGSKDGSENNDPLYLVAIHSPFYELREIAIHAGLSELVPTLATINYEDVSEAVRIQVAAHLGSGADPSGSGVRSRLRNQTRLGPRGRFTRAMAFDTAAATATGDDDAASERFEWRASKGPEVKALGGQRWGWKLVRVSPDIAQPTLPLPPPPPPPSPSSWSSSSSSLSPSSSPPSRQRLGIHKNKGKTNVAQSSDGKEIVAVWARVADRGGNKFMRFRFIGSGADGTLGDRWALMAAASALAMWTRDPRNPNTTRVTFP